jgi:hypothetical protein
MKICGLLLLLVSLTIQAEDLRIGNGMIGCDSDSISTSQKLSKLTPNQFYKICPPQTSLSFGQPKCGDGTNFAFFFTKPAQRYANNQKILIEFMGGGACWDANTCGYMADHLTFPQKLNNFVGLSCSEIAKGASGQSNKFPINMLCSEKIGDVDFREYSTIVIPYCTQDVHIGSSNVTYNDGTTIHHKGAHNTMNTLRWIFSNFKNPSHVALTGCSAGGTALPIIYDLINSHYNKFGIRTVQISTIVDSPVYLTPKYFLKNGLDNWNPWPIMKRIGFNYEKWQYNVNYPTKVWDHVLRRGSNRDKWGFVSHANDVTSQFYYEWMNGNGEDYSDYGDDEYDDIYDAIDDAFYNDSGRNLLGFSPRRLNENDNLQEQWWSQLSRSVSTIQSKHKNVKSFFIDDKGHCSFGLYYPLQVEGFDDWASSVFHENRLIGESGSTIPLFAMCAMFGVAAVAGIVYSARQKRNIHLDDDGLLNHAVETHDKSSGLSSSSILLRFRTYPVTVGYMMIMSLYFWTMLFSNSFAHPLNNPSLGPTAVTLSRYGINNPSIIIYKRQFYRLITSNFLCSGIIAYALVMISLIHCSRPLEQLLKGRFWIACSLVLLGSNLLYAMFGNGASCSSMALALGVNSFYVMVSRVTKGPVCLVFTMTFFMFVVSAVVFSFNSWFMLLSAICIGAGSAVALFDISLGAHSENTSEDGLTVFKQASPDFRLRRKPLYAVVGVYLVMCLVLLMRLRQPKELYLQPFFTGCDLMYSDDVSFLVEDYYSNRALGNKGDDRSTSLCAQFCTPHLLTKGVVVGAKRIFEILLTRGSCEDLGFNEHVADKTFKYFSYSIDVELYTASS